MSQIDSDQQLRCCNAFWLTEKALRGVPDIHHEMFPASRDRPLSPSVLTFSSRWRYHKIYRWTENMFNKIKFKTNGIHFLHGFLEMT